MPAESTQPSAEARLNLAHCRIRRMRSSDIEPGIMAIESVSFGTHHWSPSSFENELNNHMGRYFVLAEPTEGGNDIIHGYCGLWLIIDEGHITTVAVNPELRGQSLGEVMLIHMLDYVMGKIIHWLTLEVRTSNHPAQNLYYKYAFQSQGLRRKYYQDNQEDALIMTTPHIGSEDFRNTFKQNRAALLERLGGFPAGMGEG